MTDAILTAAGIRLGRTASSREEAVRLSGSILVELGAVEPEYVAAMWEREQILSSYVGESTAIPHGTNESRKYVNFAQLSFVRFASSVDWEGDDVRLVIGIASANDDHVETLGTLAEVLMDPDGRDVLMNTPDADDIVELIGMAFE